MMTSFGFFGFIEVSFTHIGIHAFEAQSVTNFAGHITSRPPRPDGEKCPPES